MEQSTLLYYFSEFPDVPNILFASISTLLLKHGLLSVCVCVWYIRLSRISGYVEFTDPKFCHIQDTRCAITALPSLALEQKMPAEPVHFIVKHAL